MSAKKKNSGVQQKRESTTTKTVFCTLCTQPIFHWGSNDSILYAIYVLYTDCIHMKNTEIKTIIRSKKAATIHPI